MEPITVSVPTYLKYGVKKPKTFALNLNVYRNTHFQTLNQMKIKFEEAVKSIIDKLPQMTKVKLTYTLFFGSNRSVDTSNVCCIVDKFFSDCLVNAGKLIDDNINVISEVSYRFGGVDPQNPRCEVTLSEYEVIEPKEEPMQIMIVQAEIEEAIKAHILNLITLKEGQEITVDFKATRGDTGATAEINIGVPNEQKSTQTATQSRSTAQPVKIPAKTSSAAVAPAVTAGEATPSETEKSVETASTTTAPTEELEPVEEVNEDPPMAEEPFSPPSFLKPKPDGNSDEAPVQKPQATAAATEPATKSLFANLQRPVNTKPE